jgi:hypothetical protein
MFPGVLVDKGIGVDGLNIHASVSSDDLITEFGVGYKKERSLLSVVLILIDFGFLSGVF